MPLFFGKKHMKNLRGLSKKKNILKILLLFRKSVNFKEMFMSWIRIHLFSVRIPDRDLYQN